VAGELSVLAFAAPPAQGCGPGLEAGSDGLFKRRLVGFGRTGLLAGGSGGGDGATERLDLALAPDAFAVVGAGGGAAALCPGAWLLDFGGAEPLQVEVPAP